METPKNRNVPFGGLSSENLNPGSGTPATPPTPSPLSSLDVDSPDDPPPSASASETLQLPSCGGSLVGCATALTQLFLGKIVSRSSSRNTLRRRATIISGRTVSPHFEKRASSVQHRGLGIRREGGEGGMRRGGTGGDAGCKGK